MILLFHFTPGVSLGRAENITILTDKEDYAPKET